MEEAAEEEFQELESHLRLQSRAGEQMFSQEDQRQGSTFGGKVTQDQKKAFQEAKKFKTADVCCSNSSNNIKRAAVKQKKIKHTKESQQTRTKSFIRQLSYNLLDKAGKLLWDGVSWTEWRDDASDF